MLPCFLRRLPVAFMTVSAVLLCSAASRAGEAANAPAELAAESEAYCNETAKDADKITPQMIVGKVDKAAKLVEEKGDAAFPAFKGKGSEFLFCGTYIWIHDLEGKMLMHPIKDKMEGKTLLNLKDKNGKLFFVEMNELVKARGAGWVEYVWPKPGEKEASPKISYVRLVKHADRSYVIGCGVYDLTMKQVEEKLGAQTK